jgi:AAA domain
MRRLHFYIYDTLDVLALKSLIERHLFDAQPPELLIELGNLLWLFPPESILPDAETFRTIPATIVVQMLRALVALPVAYGYDLRTVSERYQPASGGFQFRTPYGFSWEHSNQIAFERIHDIWNGDNFRYQSRGTTRVLTPIEIQAEIDKAVRAKLRATDSIVRRLKADLNGQLLLKKEPFQLYTGNDALQDQVLEALRIFTSLEVSFAELDVKRTHTLPISDRVASFVCLHGMQAVSDTLDTDGSLWCTFDATASDTKFEPGDFNLVLTPAGNPSILLSDIDGELFSSSNRWRYAPYKVSLLEYNLQVTPPQVRLAPDNPQQFTKAFNPSGIYVLDRLFVDYNSVKVFEVLQRLASSDMQDNHVQSLLVQATVARWEPFVTDTTTLEATFRARLTAVEADPDRLLNSGQWRAWRGVFQEPLTLVWGPPGTGKTHTIAHILIGYMLAARQLNRPIRVLVTAFTHHAINNVLRKVAELAERYRISADDIQIAKMQRGAASASDAALPSCVTMMDTDGFAGTLGSATPCLIVGATVWAVHRAMKDAGDVVQPWFDVVLIDEASQLKLPDALIAFSASQPGANIILAGDDRQLPPIIHGVYPEEHAHLLSSVFAFVRSRVDQQRDTRPDLEARILFMLEENFRMNEPLTAYPRDVLYGGRFLSTKPSIRIATAEPITLATDDLLEYMLHPDRPVLLVRYRPPRSFTARNPLEAELAARIVARLRDILIDGITGTVYTPTELEREGIAILSPHRAQNSTIRQALSSYGFGTSNQPMPLVDTVDKLQGQERDVVIVSYGVTDSEYAEDEAEFLLSSNRFNVAATRARHKLIVLCADTVLDVVPTDQQVLLDAMMLKEFRRYCDSGLCDIPWTTTNGETVTFHVQWKEFAS